MNFKTEKQSRRSFLKTFSLFALAAAFVAQMWMAMRFLLFKNKGQKPTRFKVGLPTDFEQGITFLPEHKLFLLRRGNQFSALSAVCTHLGCTVKISGHSSGMLSSTNKSSTAFKCPCHGSQFDAFGHHLSGPAPKALQRYALLLSADDGQLVVDTNQKVDELFTFTA